MNQLRQAIKTYIRIINSAIKQLPSDKRPLITTRLHQVLTKHTKQEPDQNSLLKFKKQLEFNLNFIKLSHPNLDYTPPQQQTEQQRESQNKNTQDQQQFEHQFKLMNEDNIQIDRLQTKDTFDEQLQKEKSVRQEVDFTNWFDGNADPEQLKKHKQLLERQHFQGQYWKDKEKPKSIAKQYLLSSLGSTPEGVQIPNKDKTIGDFKPKEVEQQEEVWQKVKR